MRYGQTSFGLCPVCGDTTRKQASFDTEEEREAWEPDFHHVACRPPEILPPSGEIPTKKEIQ